jgi:hypothetical protein
MKNTLLTLSLFFACGACLFAQQTMNCKVNPQFNNIAVQSFDKGILKLTVKWGGPNGGSTLAASNLLITNGKCTTCTPLGAIGGKRPQDTWTITATDPKQPVTIAWAINKFCGDEKIVTQPTAAVPSDLLVVNLSNGQTIYVSPVDNTPNRITWGGIGVDINNLPKIGNNPTTDFNGKSNTAAIVAQLGANNNVRYAAKVCDDLVAYGFDDWYLPSAGELNEIYKTHGPSGTNKFKATKLPYQDIDSLSPYSSSTGYTVNDKSYVLNFATGQTSVTARESENLCRCVRK